MNQTIMSRNKADIENHCLCFFNVAIEEKLDKRVFFLYQISFSFSCKCLVSMFRKTE